MFGDIEIIRLEYLEERHLISLDLMSNGKSCESHMKVVIAAFGIKEENNEKVLVRK